MKESELQAKICEYLATKKLCFSRINNTPVFDPVRKKFRSMGKYVMKGFPDIIVIKSCNFIGIECKSDKGVQSADQKEAQRRIEKEGGEYYLVRTWKNFVDIGL